MILFDSSSTKLPGPVLAALAVRKNILPKIIFKRNDWINLGNQRLRAILLFMFLYSVHTPIHSVDVSLIQINFDVGKPNAKCNFPDPENDAALGRHSGGASVPLHAAPVDAPVPTRDKNGRGSRWT